MSGPRVLCACCAKTEVPFDQIVCPDCRSQLVAAGILKPEPVYQLSIPQPAEVA